MPRRSAKGVGHRCVAFVRNESDHEVQCDGLTGTDHVSHPRDNSYTRRDRVCLKCGAIQTSIERTVASSIRRSRKSNGIYTSCLSENGTSDREVASLFD